MWGKPPFSIVDNSAVDVRDLSAARNWFKEKLGLKEARFRREDDSGRPFVDLQTSDNSGILTLVQLAPGTDPAKTHAIFTSNYLEKASRWMLDRGIAVEPLSSDSGGNQFFGFHDFEGNRIEVCKEPG